MLLSHNDNHWAHIYNQIKDLADFHVSIQNYTDFHFAYRLQYLVHNFLNILCVNDTCP